MSERELNGIKLCTEVRTQTHVFRKRGDTAAGKPVDMVSYPRILEPSKLQ
jgi:hypothetical protein